MPRLPFEAKAPSKKEKADLTPLTLVTRKKTSIV